LTLILFNTDEFFQAFPWARVIRTVPSTPCLVNSGIVLYCQSETSTPEDLELTRRLLSSCAECVLLPEKLIDAGQAISGCGPAFVSFMLHFYCFNLQVTRY